MFYHFPILFGMWNDWQVCSQTRRQGGQGWEEENREPGNFIKHLGSGQEQDGLSRAWCCQQPLERGQKVPLGQGLQHPPVGLHKFWGLIWIKLILLLSPYSCLLSNLGFPFLANLYLLIQPSMPYFCYLLLTLPFAFVPVFIWTGLFGLCECTTRF